VTREEHARIRFLVSPPGTSVDDQRRRRQIGEHEFRAVQALNHDGILRPRDLVETELGVGLVYPLSTEFRRLDLWLADHPEGVPLATQLDLLRQVGEAIGYAHRHRVVHRDLTPAAVLVLDRADGSVQVVVTDWQTAGSAGGTTTGPGARLVTALGTSVLNLVHGADAATRGVYQAPEGVWLREVDRIKIDVFALGAVGYYLLTRRPPAADGNALRERLQRDKGLDLAADLPQVLSSLRTLVLDATRPAVGDRLASIGAFLDKLAEVERAVAEPDQAQELDPLKALPGTVFRSRYRLQRRLVSGGATNVTLDSITVQQYATGRQAGAIHPDTSASGWMVRNVSALRNYWAGLMAADNMKILGGHYNDNDQLGIGGNAATGVLLDGLDGDPTTMDGPELARNHTLHASCQYEAGGMKWDVGQVTIRNAHVHDNDCRGLWADINAHDALIEHNLIEDNQAEGVFCEISQDVVIRYNRLYRNGARAAGWYWDAGITVNASFNVEVYGNACPATTTGSPASSTIQSAACPLSLTSVMGSPCCHEHGRTTWRCY
jgi:hypothetical protein